MEHGRMRANMPLDENDKRRLVLRLVTHLRCVECGRLYDPEDFALVQRRKDVWVLNTRCRYCDEPCHVVVFLRLATEPNPLTDLTPDEAQDLSRLPPISSDDVLDIHVLLEGFDGDIEKLFNP
jgi:hypothetical protein